MHNLTSPAPQVGDSLVWPCGETHEIARVDGSKLYLTGYPEYVYPAAEIGNFYTLVKAVVAPKAPPRLTPQAHTVLTHITKAGSITQREAIVDHSVQSLTRRITEIRDAGFDIAAEFRYHPITGQRYARYSLALANSL